MIRKRRLRLLEELAVSSLPLSRDSKEKRRLWEPRYGDWIRLIRTSLRMTQAELARRAGVNEANLVAIERGTTDPRISTLKKIFDALSCDLLVEPRPRQPFNEILREKARSVAITRLKQSMGTMALENQAPTANVFEALVEKRTDEILNDTREHLWHNRDEQRRRNNRRNAGR